MFYLLQVPAEARGAVAAAQLFEELPSPSLNWLEDENEDVLTTILKLRDLVSQVAVAALDQENYVNNELPSLLAALRLQATLSSSSIERQIAELEHDGLSTEYAQLNSILADARATLPAVVSS